MKRRDFLKNLGFIATGIIISPSLIANKLNEDTFEILYKYYLVSIPDNFFEDSEFHANDLFLKQIQAVRDSGIYCRGINGIEKERDFETLSTKYHLSAVAIDCPEKYWERLDKQDFEGKYLKLNELRFA